MTLSLRIDEERFRQHLLRTYAQHPDLVPVAKGNGYGLGLTRLAELSAWLGVDTVAVGTYQEVAPVADAFPGSLVVLSPRRPFEAPLPPTGSPMARRLIHTIGRVSDLEQLLDHDPEARFVLELLTSMRRHGFDRAGLREAAAVLADRPDARLEGIALHLPMAGTSQLSEVRRLLNDSVAAGIATDTVWVSHLTAGELATITRDWPDYRIRPRIGTDLWLGDRGALEVTATVLDLHPVERGEPFGYRGRTAPRAGTIVVVSGGTAHGIGLESPLGAGSLKARAATIARGGLDAAGFVRSPFSIGGKQRLFAEPPHMQASMLFLPQDAAVPAVGDEVPVRVRYTATEFDRVSLA